MQVGAASRLLAVGLGHERRLHAELQCDALDQALEADGVVTGEQRIVDVVQVDLELAGAVFGEHGARRQFLRACCRVDRGEHLRILIHLLHGVDLGLVLAPPGERLARRLRTAFGRALAVDEVELQLDRHHGRQAEPVEPCDHALEHVPRIAVERRAVVLVHADLHLRDLLAEPGHGHQCSGDGQADTVGVTLVEPEAGALHRAATHVEREHRRRQQQAVTVHALQLLDRDALAPRDAHLVGEQQVDASHQRPPAEPGARLADVRELRHANPVV